MTYYEVFKLLIVILAVLFIVIDYFFQKSKVYEFLESKLSDKFSLDSGLYNLNYSYPYKNILDLLNYSIKNIYTLIKLTTVLSIIFFIFYGTILIFSVPLTLVLLSVALIIILKKFSLKRYVIDKSIKKLEKYQPSFIFYFSAPSKSFSYHIKMWLPYLKLLNMKFYIMVREKHHLVELLTFVEDTPIVIAPSLDCIEKYLPTSVNMAFYANNGTKNTHLVRFNHLLHIQLLHGDSEKPPSYNPVSKMYDKLFVSGQRAIDRYIENGVTIPKENFEIIGRPQISNIKLIENFNKEIYTVLFAPTWVGFHEDTKFSSLFYIYDVIKYLLESKFKVKIILRLHPLTDRSDEKTNKYLKKIENLLENGKDTHILYSNRDIIDDFNDSDSIVTDVSSVPIDYLYSLKPIVHIDVNKLSGYFKTDRRYEQYRKSVYMIDENYTNLDKVFTSVFENDLLLDKRKTVKSYYHGSFDKPVEEVFVSTVKRLYREKIKDNDK